MYAETQWKLIYVGSADDEAYDQLLEDVFVASVNLGTYRFLLEVDTPVNYLNILRILIS